MYGKHRIELVLKGRMMKIILLFAFFANQGNPKGNFCHKVQIPSS